MKLVEGFDSNYRYVLVAARRARQLQNGAPPGGGAAFAQGLPHRRRRNQRRQGEVGDTGASKTPPKSPMSYCRARGGEATISRPSTMRVQQATTDVSLCLQSNECDALRSHVRRRRQPHPI